MLKSKGTQVKKIDIVGVFCGTISSKKKSFGHQKL